MSNFQINGDNNFVINAGGDVVLDPAVAARLSRSGASTPLPPAESVPFVEYLRDRLVRDKDLHDLSRNAELADFPLIGFHTSTLSMNFVALRVADRLTETQIVSLRNKFFDVVQHLSRDLALKPRGRNPNGLLLFVFTEGCSDAMAGFVRKQTKISHSAASGAVTVSWAVDLRHRHIHTHENPVSIFPPVVILPQAVFPGSGWMESVLASLPDHVGASPVDPATGWMSSEKGRTSQDNGRAGRDEPERPTSSPSAGVTRILVLSANSTRKPLDLEREVSRIEQEIRMAKTRDTLEFRHVSAATSDTLMRAVLEESPTIVHFAGHGGPRGIHVRDELGNPRELTGEALARLFNLSRDTLRCVVLNACWSEPQAKAIRRHIPHVIGTRAGILDKSALAFAAGFYTAIGAGKDIALAFEAGKTRVHMEGTGDEDIPVLL